MKKKSFEENLAQLEQIVGELEKGELSLQLCLEKFEKGADLYKDCQKDLKSMEKKIEVIKKSLEDVKE